MRDNTINLEFGFDIFSAEAIDSRIVLTKYDMEQIGKHDDDATSKYNSNRFPDNYFAVLVDSEGVEPPQLYVFDKSKINTSEGSSDPSNIGGFFRIDYEYIKKHPKLNGVELVGDHNGDYYNLQDKLIEKEGIQLTSGVDSEGKAIKLIKVKIDDKTIAFNANGELHAVIKDGIATESSIDSAGDSHINVKYDDRTVKVNADNELTLPIDEVTLIVNSAGELTAVPEPLADGVATEVKYIGRTETVNVKFDNDTITLNSAGELCGTPQLSQGKANEILDSEGIINVRVDDETIKVNGANNLEVIRDEATVKLGSEGLYVPIDNLTIFINSEGKVASMPEPLADGRATHAEYDGRNEIVSVNVDNVAVKIDSEGNHLYIDEAGLKRDHTIVIVDSEGSEGACLGIKLENGDAIRVDNRNVINVEYDKDSLELEAGNKLAAHLNNIYLKKNSEGIYVNIDDDTLYYDSSEDVLRSKIAPVSAGKGVWINSSTRKIDVDVDYKTIKIGADNKVRTNIDKKTLVYSSSEDVVKANVDLDTIYFNSEGKLRSRQTYIDEKTIILNSEGKIETQVGGWKETASDYVFANQSGTVASSSPIITMSWGGTYCPEVGQVLSCDVNIGAYPLVTETFTLVNDGDYVSGSDASHTYLDGIKFKKDLSEIVYEFDGTVLPPSASFSVRSHGDSNLYHPIDGRYINIDNKSIVLDPTTLKLSATAKDLFAGEAIALDSENRINVLYDNKTVNLDSQGRLHAAGYKVFDFASITFNDVKKALSDNCIVEAYDGNYYYSLTGVYSDHYYFSLVDRNNSEDLVAAKAVKLDSSDVLTRYDAKPLQEKLTTIPNGALKISPLDVQNKQQIEVLYDDDTITLNSEGKLHTDIKELVKDVLIKVDPALGSEGFFSVKGTNKKAYIDLSDYSTDSETGHKIGLTLDSEYKLTISLYNVLGDELNHEMVDLPLEEMIIDGRYVDTSEGGYILLTLKNGHEIKIPLDQLVDGLVTLRSTQTITGSKDFMGELKHLGWDVLSALNVDGVTIKWNDSEGVIEATGLEVKAGDAVAINVDSESTSIKIVKRLDVLADDKSIKVNGSNKLEVIPDEDTIILTSEGVTANLDDVTLIVGSEGIAANLDYKTLIITESEGKIATQIGGWKEITSNHLFGHFTGTVTTSTTTQTFAGVSEMPEAGEVANVTTIWDGTTFTETCGRWVDTGLYMVATNNSNLYVKQIRLKKDNSAAEVTFGNTKILGVGSSFDVTVRSNSNLYHPIDGRYIPVDGRSVILNSEGELEATAKDLLGGEAIAIDSENVINALYDDSTIKLGADNKLYVPLHKAIEVNSEGLNVVIDNKTIRYSDSENAIYSPIDNKTIVINSEDLIEVPIDNETIIINSEDKVALPIDRKTIIINSEGKLQATFQKSGSIKPINIDANGVISLLYDNKTITLTSEGSVNVPIDNLTIIINSEGKVAAVPEPLQEGIATKPRYDGRYEVVDVIYDNATIKYDNNSEGLYLPIDNVTIIIDSEGFLQAVPEPLKDGEATSIRYEGRDEVVDIIRDNKTIRYKDNSEGLYIPLDYSTIIIGSEGNVEVPIDNLTIIINSEGKIETVTDKLQDGIATKVVYAGRTGQIDVQYDDKTIVLDSEGKLIANIDNLTITFDSEGKLMAVPEPLKDGIATEVKYEGRDEVVNVLFDEASIVLDSEGKLKTNIDNLTIVFNSEGQLMAVPEPLKDGEATHIHYDGRDEVVDVVRDNVTIKFNDNSEGLYIPIDYETIVVNSEGKVAVPIDNETIIIDSEGHVAIVPIPVADVKALWESLI